MAIAPIAMSTAPVTLLREVDEAAVRALLARFNVQLIAVPDGEPIPYSYWGAPEAGLDRRGVYVRADTPVHSLLHELCHYVCMDDARRRVLVTDAGGDPDEECGVCYLQILLADALPGFGREKALDDMDAWGYSFREGSSRAWWGGDARFAREWLLQHGLIDAQGRITWRLRE